MKGKFEVSLPRVSGSNQMLALSDILHRKAPLVFLVILKLMPYYLNSNSDLKPNKITPEKMYKKYLY
jgi:hypothetical protein